MKTLAIAAVTFIALAGCKPDGPPTGANRPDLGADPSLADPQHNFIPTVKFAKPIGWLNGATPVAAPGLKVQALATGLEHPRELLALPNGDVLVAETDSPPAPPPKGVRDVAERAVMGMVGAATQSPNRIVLLHGMKPDGSGAQQSVYITGLTSPFGMALVGKWLYVADTDALLKFPYDPAASKVTAAPVKVIDLPAFPIDHHWTKTLAVSADATKLFVSIGSNSNVGENGIAAEAGRARVIVVDLATGQQRAYATGLRNAVGLAVQPGTGTLWAVVNERDELGDNLPPDYFTSVKDGGFYGWPYAYWGKHVDTRMNPPRPDLVAQALTPDFALGSHVAPLGLVFDTSASLPAKYSGGAFIGEHGSWNRSVLAGYRVVFIPFAGGKPAGPPQDVLSGFIDAKGEAQGRPVGVTLDSAGALLVADDVGDAVWRVTAK